MTKPAATPEQLRRALDQARDEGLIAVAAARDRASLEQARVRIFGRKAPLARARAGLGSLPEQLRRELGALANEVQSQLEDALARRRAEVESAERAARWEAERVDVTLPGDTFPVANLHPLTQTMWELVDVFVGLGYRVADGPEVELTRYIFDALNMPPSHPARSAQDTFFVAGGRGEIVLRTETSPVQIRTMEQTTPPVYVVCPGRVYRRDVSDATHLPAFTQMEGLAVDEGVTMADLKGTLELAARHIFGQDTEIRLRPHFFPFTEPSAELDVRCFACRGADRSCRLCKGEGWIEVLGCGMVDPFLLEWVGYDAERYTGFAFGMGIERICALSHGVGDIRDLWANHLAFNSQFRRGA